MLSSSAHPSSPFPALLSHALTRRAYLFLTTLALFFATLFIIGLLPFLSLLGLPSSLSSFLFAIFGFLSLSCFEFLYYPYLIKVRFEKGGNNVFFFQFFSFILKTILSSLETFFFYFFFSPKSPLGSFDLTPLYSLLITSILSILISIRVRKFILFDDNDFLLSTSTPKNILFEMGKSLRSIALITLQTSPFILFHNCILLFQYPLPFLLQYISLSLLLFFLLQLIPMVSTALFKWLFLSPVNFSTLYSPSEPATAFFLSFFLRNERMIVPKKDTSKGNFNESSMWNLLLKSYQKYTLLLPKQSFVFQDPSSLLSIGLFLSCYDLQRIFTLKNRRTSFFSSPQAQEILACICSILTSTAFRLTALTKDEVPSSSEPEVKESKQENSNLYRAPTPSSSSFSSSLILKPVKYTVNVISGKLKKLTEVFNRMFKTSELSMLSTPFFPPLTQAMISIVEALTSCLLTALQEDAKGQAQPFIGPALMSLLALDEALSALALKARRLKSEGKGTLDLSSFHLVCKRSGVREEYPSDLLRQLARAVDAGIDDLVTAYEDILGTLNFPLEVPQTTSLLKKVSKKRAAMAIKQ